MTPRPPGLALWATEYSRSTAEFWSAAWAWRTLGKAPQGRGEPVIVLPGFATSDLSTVTLRRYLAKLGYRPLKWNLGVNIGPTRKIVEGMRRLVDETADSTGQPVSIVGWSLGGIFARQLARRDPKSVRSVITLGSPIRLQNNEQSNARWLFSMFEKLHIEPLDLPLERGLGPLPVPATSIYSRYDGIVAWPACLDLPSPRSENIEVYSSHLGFGHHPAALWAIADRLAQAPGSWRPFVPPRMGRLLYPEPKYPRAEEAS